MANITLSIPNDAHKEMKKHPEIRWSDVARQAIMKRIEDLKTLDLLLEKSRMKKGDVEEIAQTIKVRVWQRHKERMGTLRIPSGTGSVSRLCI